MERQRQVADLNQIEIKSVMDLENVINRGRAGKEVVLIAYRDSDEREDVRKQPPVVNPT